MVFKNPLLLLTGTNTTNNLLYTMDITTWPTGNRSFCLNVATSSMDMCYMTAKRADKLKMKQPTYLKMITKSYKKMMQP